MRRTVGSIVVVALVVFGFGSVGGSQTTGVNRSDLGRGQVGGDYKVEGASGTDVVVQKVTFEPGAIAAWHTHPGPETAIIASGTLTIFMSDHKDCAPHEYKPGQVFVGTGKVVHQAKNLGKEPVQLVVTYFNVPAGGPVATPAQRPANCPE